MDDLALLRLDELCAGYGGEALVGPIDAALGPGLYEVRGSNGSGKTTLLRTMCGELRAIGGQCLVQGRSVWADVAVRAQIAYVSAVPEQPDFLSVEECWRMYAALRGLPDWDGVLWQVRFGLDGAMPLAQCSAGQRRRAELIAALAADPSVLLLDEVLANLDPQSVAVVADALEQWREDRVVILTSHQPLPVKVDACFELAARRPLVWEVA